MYDFGFYLEHSDYFKVFLDNAFTCGTKITNLNDFDVIMQSFAATVAKDPKFTTIKNASKDILVAFGIRFFKIFEVDMEEVTKKDPPYPVAEKLLERCKFWYGKTDADKVETILKAKNACFTPDGKWPGTYIWKFGKNEFYVGEADDIIGRLVNYNGANKGQTPNIKVNNRIWQAAHNKNKKETVELYFYPTEHHHDDVEQYIINRARKYGYKLPLNDKDNK